MWDVETITKYEVSKALLLEWPVSKHVEAALGRTTLENLKSWIIKKILPFANQTLILAPRLNRRTFGEYVNSVAEIEGAIIEHGCW